MPITGIQLELETGQSFWDSSGDKLFLGVYSKFGGREFRLNDGVNFSDDGKSYIFRLGAPVCIEDIPVVNNSTNYGVNDPQLNPISLSDIEFVYLRKETADSTPNNDDWLLLDYASVLIADDKKQLRKFEKRRAINFSDESG